MLTEIKKNTDLWDRLFRETGFEPHGAGNEPVDTITVKGDVSLLIEPIRRPRIAVIGTRDISTYGVDAVNKIISALSMRADRPVIISGLAFGVDVEAHRAALALGLPTVAVLPTYVNEIYPKQHEHIATEITAREGCCLLSQFKNKTAPMAINFLFRNNTIAHIADAVVVVESKERGGAMVTARCAVDAGIPVFAVPGRMDDVRSAGCNSLIEQGVATILSRPEILTTYNF